MFSKIKPIIINCKNLRIERQKENNQKLISHIYEKNKDSILKSCNVLELNRLLEELQITFPSLIDKCCEDSTFTKLLVSKISKNSSRQGNKDEAFILEKCNETLEKVGIFITKLGNNKYRPSKCGRIISDNELKSLALKKNDYLKSFDGKISGKCDGWIFSKITYTNGGHQDNVFEEAHQFCEWVIKFGQENLLYTVMIDTDLIISICTNNNNERAM